MKGKMCTIISSQKFFNKMLKKDAECKGSNCSRG